VGGVGNGRDDKRSPVVVIGQNRQFLYYVSPGRARILLRDGEARIFGRMPPVLELCPGSNGAPTDERFLFRFPDESVRVLDQSGTTLACTIAAKAWKLILAGKAKFLCHQPPTIRLLRVVREERRSQVDKHEFLDSQGKIVNWAKFWSEERDIYIRNLTESNISLMIGIGKDAYYVSIPVSPDPLNLSSEVSFEDLKKSQDFKKIANARDKKGRPLIQVMDEHEYREYYQSRAEALKVTTDEAIRRAEQARSLYKQRVKEETPAEPVHRVVEETPKQFVTEDETIRDRLRVLMHQIHQDVLDEQSNSKLEGRAFDPSKIKFTASKVLTELTSMKDFTPDELEHVISRGYWPSVKRWATTEIQKLREIPDMVEAPIESDDGDAFIQRQGMVG